MTETLAHGTHLRAFSESLPMNTSMTGFRRFSKIVASLCFRRISSLSIGRVKDTAIYGRSVKLKVYYTSQGSVFYAANASYAQGQYEGGTGNNHDALLTLMLLLANLSNTK